MSATITRYAALTRGRAAAIIGLFLVAEAWFVAGASSHAGEAAAQSAPAPHRDGDIAFYKSVVARVRAGENYYDVVDIELRRQGYPVRPAFAWRQPTYAWLLSRLPSPLIGNVFLAIVGIAVVWLTRRWIGTTRARASVATALMVISMCTCCVRDSVFLQESWAGALIALSVCASALECWPVAVASGLAALAFRELALLPCLLGLLMALRRHRWAESSAWLAGLVAYAILMRLHLAEVTRHLRPGDFSRGWLAMGGARFLVQTCKWSPLLIALPDWLVALVLPFVLLGLAGWRGDSATRVALIVFGYMAIFSIAGHPFNDYWGAIFAPLLAFGLMAAPDCVRDLARALRGDHAASAQGSGG
jgi:hypothetical protein